MTVAATSAIPPLERVTPGMTYGCQGDNGATWTEMTVDAPWQTRGSHSSVVLADGSILVMGGYHHAEGNPYDPAGTTIFLNDVWRLADNGATWDADGSTAHASGRCKKLVLVR